MQLLAEDVESRLEALLRTFIQEEKLRQEARYNSLMGKRSASLSALNSDYTDAGSPELSGADYSVSPISRSLYGPQLSRSGGGSGLTANKSNNFGYVKPQQHRMQQSYQLHNSQNVNTPQQQKPTAIKTSHRLDASPGRSSSVQSNSPGSKVVVTRTRSPSPTGRQQSSGPSSNLFPVNRNNLFGQHQRADQASKATSTMPANKPTSYLNLHQRSQSPSKDGNQPAIGSKSSQQPQSSQLVSSKPHTASGQQFLGHGSSHRLYAPSSNQSKFYDPFSTSSSQFGRSKDDSHIRRVVVYNLKDAASASEKKPVIIEQQQGLKSVNGTLNNGYAPNVTSGSSEKTETADNQAIRLRSAKTRANSPNRVGMLNGSGNMSAASGAAQIGQSHSSGAGKQAANSLATGRLALSSPANTAAGGHGKSSSGSSLNSNTNSQAAGKKLSSSGSSKLAGSTTNSPSSRLAAGHENASSLQQFKDHNNNLDSKHVGVGSAAQLNTERKVVRKLIVKELDGARNESAVNSSGASSGSGGLNKPTSSTYQQQQQRLSPISNGDLNSVPTMAALNTQPAPTGNQLNHHPVSSLDALLSERDRILNNRDQYKQLRSNALASDLNNNYLLSMNNKFNAALGDLSPSSGLSGSSSAAGLLSSAGLAGNRTALGGHQSAVTNRNLPLSSSAASAKRKPLVDRYSPFSIVNEARQRFEETVKNGMNHPSPSRFHSLDNSLENCDLDLNADPLDLSDELLFNELAAEQSDEEIVDSSMVLIRARLSRLLNGNGHNVNVANLPNSAILSLLNHLSNAKQTEHQPLTLPLPACLAELNRIGDEPLPLNASHNTPFSLLSPNSAPLSASPSIATINSMRPPLIITNPSDCMRKISLNFPLLFGQTGLFHTDQWRERSGCRASLAFPP